MGEIEARSEASRFGGVQGVSRHESSATAGALVTALRNPDRHRSVSAFAPSAAPSRCPWGRRAFAAAPGPDASRWQRHGASELVSSSRWRREILIDQGDTDGFSKEQLLPERFESRCREAGVPRTLRIQAGYDRSYYFISTFMADHVSHHARALLA